MTLKLRAEAAAGTHTVVQRSHRKDRRPAWVSRKVALLKAQVTPPLCLLAVEKLRATFTVLRAFGCVSTGHSRRATRFAMVMSLDFNATGRVTAAQLQVRPGDGPRLFKVWRLWPAPTFPVRTLG